MSKKKNIKLLQQEVKELKHRLWILENPEEAKISEEMKKIFIKTWESKYLINEPLHISKSYFK